MKPTMDFSLKRQALYKITGVPIVTYKPKKRVYCYNRADWDALREEMTEISRHYYERNENSTRSVEENWNYIRDNLLKAIDTYVPVKFQPY